VVEQSGLASAKESGKNGHRQVRRFNDSHKDVALVEVNVAIAIVFSIR
jgi:hypothetical protein